MARLTTLLQVIFGLSVILVSAQIPPIPGLPQCAQACVTQQAVAAIAGGCAPTDIACLCKSLPGALQCSAKVCSAEDQKAATVTLTGLCLVSGMTTTTTKTTSTHSSSTTPKTSTSTKPAPKPTTTTTKTATNSSQSSKSVTTSTSIADSSISSAVSSAVTTPSAAISTGSGTLSIPDIATSSSTDPQPTTSNGAVGGHEGGLGLIAALLLGLVVM